MATDKKRLNLVLSQTLFEKLEKSAAENKTTMTAALIYLIKIGLLVSNAKEVTIDGRKLLVIR